MSRNVDDLYTDALTEIARAQADKEALQAQLEQARAAFRKLMGYRNRNTLNFQLEKLDDYLRELKNVLGEVE